LSRHNIERGLSLIFKGTMYINIVAQETDLSDTILKEGSVLYFHVQCTMYINISDGKKIDKNSVNPFTINT